MSVIENVGGATSKGIESTGRGFSEATEGLPWWAKGLIIAGAIGGGLYIVYYVSKNLVSGFTGTDCNQPGSPCYNALQPYVETYNICAKQYAYYLDLYLKEDAANGTGFTSAQLDQLNYLYNCMNDASKNIADTAKQFNNNPLDTVAYFAGLALLSVGVGYGLSAIIKALRTTPSNGSTFGSIIRNAMMRQKIANGEITVDQASGLVRQSSDLQNVDVTTNDAFYRNLAQREIIASEVADSIRTTIDEEMVADDMETAEILVRLK